MDGLPGPLLSSILALAVPDYAEDLAPHKRELPVDSLKSLALVCKAWQAVINDIVDEFLSSTLTLTYLTGSPTELAEIRRRASEKGTQVLDLRVCMGKLVSRRRFHDNSDAIAIRKCDAPPLDAVDLGWDSLFQHFTNLKRLDLTLITLTSPHVKQVVEAAGKYCPDLEVLVLPGRFRAINARVAPDPIDSIDSTLAAVYKAAEQWRAAGSRGGLRQLTVPTLNDDDRFNSCADFIGNVVKYCPTVEYLDGYVYSVRDTDVLTCRQFWPLTVDLWEKFCATCTSLREFNWVVAPFGNPFFQAFGETIKPQLKKLMFGVNMFWDWEYYFRSCDEALGVEANTTTPATRPGYGANATDVASALKGCPALQELHVNLYHPLDRAGRGFMITANSTRWLFPRNEVITLDAFGDSFCEALVTHCPMVEHITIKEVATEECQTRYPIQTFTDAGLSFLAKLKFLKTLHLRPINCSATGLFQFLNSLSDEFSGQRTLELAVAGNTRDLSMDFYVFLQELLRLLGNASPHELACTHQKFVLRVCNSGDAVMNSVWGESYISILKCMVEKVTNKHKSLRVRVVSTGKCAPAEFESIREFTISTLPTAPASYFVVESYDSDSDSDSC